MTVGKKEGRKKQKKEGKKNVKDEEGEARKGMKE
jgi:hypothetical protein